MAHIRRVTTKIVNKNGWTIITHDKWMCCANGCGEVYDDPDKASHCHDM